MRLNWILPLTALLSLPVAALAQPAEPLVFNDNDTLSLKLSDTNINRFFVSNDTIVDVYASKAFREPPQVDSQGALYLQLQPSEPFTAFITTKDGHTVGVILVPVRASGKNVHLIPRTATDKARLWEEKKNYESGLMRLMKAMMQNHVPKGYGVEEVSNAPQRFDSHGQLRLKAIYNGIHFKGKVYTLYNEGQSPLYIQEKDFYRDGVEAVAFSTDTLESCQTSLIYVVEKQS